MVLCLSRFCEPSVSYLARLWIYSRISHPCLVHRFLSCHDNIHVACFLCILYSRVQLALQMQIIHLFFMITNIFDRLQSISTEPTRRIKTLFWCVCCCAFDWIFSLVKFIKKYWEVQIVWCKQPNVCQKTKYLCNLSIKCSFFSCDISNKVKDVHQSYKCLSTNEHTSEYL